MEEQDSENIWKFSKRTTFSEGFQFYYYYGIKSSDGKTRFERCPQKICSIADPVEYEGPGIENKYLVNGVISFDDGYFIPEFFVVEIGNTGLSVGNQPMNEE